MMNNTNKWKTMKITATSTVSKGDNIDTWLKSVIPDCYMADIVLDFDFENETPSVRNQLCFSSYFRGIATGGVRYRDGAYQSYSLNASYDFIANAGDIFTVYYLERP